MKISLHQGFLLVDIKKNTICLDRKFKNLQISKGKTLFFQNQELFFLLWKEKNRFHLNKT